MLMKKRKPLSALMQLQPLNKRNLQETLGAAIDACDLYIDSGGWMCNVVSANGAYQTSPDTGSSVCVIVRASSIMQIFALPLWDQVFIYSNLTHVHSKAQCPNNTNHCIAPLPRTDFLCA
jgi:hypothetical protein